MTEPTHKPKVLYIPVPEPIHDEESWKILNEKFELVYYDSETIEDWCNEANKPDGKYAGIEAICRPNDLRAPPYGSHILFRGEPAMSIPKTVELIVSSGHGYDYVDVEYLTSRGILFCNSPDCCSIATADVGTFLVLQTFRYMTYGEDQLRKGNFFQAINELNHISENPNGKTLGVIGLGNIGFLTAKACKAFGMSIAYFGRSAKPEYEKQIEGLKFYDDLNEMLAITDCILVACPLTDETRHLINRDRFKHMKDRVRIVNVGRGPIVQESALVEALESGQLVGAGLDVFEFEPKVDERLLSSKRVTVLPHVGACARDSYQAFEKKCVDNLMKYFYGDGKPAAVNKKLLN